MKEVYSNLLRYIIDFDGDLKQDYIKRLANSNFSVAHLNEYDVVNNKFTESLHAIIFDFCMQYFLVYKCAPTDTIIENELSTHPGLTVFQKTSLAEILEEIVVFKPVEAEFDFIIDQINEKFTANKVLQTTQRTVDKLRDKGSKAALSYAQNGFSSIAQTSKVNESPYEKSQFMWSMMEQSYKDIQDSGGLIGDMVPYGFKDWDESLGGMASGELIVLSGQANVGKSFVASEIAYHNGVDNNRNVVLVNLEMTVDQIKARLISRQTQIPSKKFRQKRLSDEELERALAVLEDLKTRQDSGLLFIPASRATSVEMIKREIDYYYGDKHVDLIVIDYLDDLARFIPGNRPMWEKVDLTVRECKGLALHYGNSVVSITQNNPKGWDNSDAGISEVAYRSIVKVADTMFMLTENKEVPELETGSGEDFVKLKFINAKLIRSRNDDKNQMFMLSADFARTQIHAVNEGYLNQLMPKLTFKERYESKEL